jgi:hypothetical protein
MDMTINTEYGWRSKSKRERAADAAPYQIAESYVPVAARKLAREMAAAEPVPLPPTSKGLDRTRRLSGVRAMVDRARAAV